MKVRLTLRKRLTLAYAAIFLSLLVALSVLLYGSIRLQLEDAADDDLRSKGDAIVRLLKDPDGERETESVFDALRERLETVGKLEIVQLRDPKGLLLFKSGNTAEIQLSPNRGFSTKHVGAKTFRFYRQEATLPLPYTLEIGVDRSEYQEALESIRASLSLGIPIALLLSLLAGYWMSGRVLRPIQLVTATVRDIDGRKLAVRLPLRGSQDELDDLSETLNGMLDRLQGTFHRMVRFTADASHELRTPLTLIRGNTEIMRAHSQLPAIADARAYEILAEVDRMQVLIEDLLELARGDEHGSLPAELLDPADLTRRAAEVGAQLAAQKGVVLKIVGPKEIFPVSGNDRALSRALVILLDNAIRHTPSGHEVRLVVASLPELLRIEVVDTGSGISKEHLPHLFERFYRTDDARNRSVGGAGLGLAIAHGIVTAHHGVISVESQPGYGSTFRIVLPAAADSTESPITHV